MGRVSPLLSFFFFNDTATTEIYTLSLHDALPISTRTRKPTSTGSKSEERTGTSCGASSDRKSTRLNSSHQIISYAVFCLKKKEQTARRGERPGLLRCLSGGT